MDIGIPDQYVSSVDSIVNHVQQTDSTPHVGSLDELPASQLDVMIIEGDDGYSAALKNGCDIPLLPVDASPGIEPVPLESLGNAIAAITARNAECIDRIGLRVESGPVETMAAYSLVVGTDEPAAISEFAVLTGDCAICRYRADGIIISTPAGTSTYPRSAGSAQIGPSVHALSVLPLSPYRKSADDWILAPDDIRIEILREEVPVAILADAHTSEPISPGSVVRIRGLPRVTTIRVPDSRSPFFE